MATYVIGDIHGSLPPLADVLCQIEKETVRGDSVVFVGDYIDRGPDTKRCIEATRRTRVPEYEARSGLTAMRMPASCAE